MPRKVVPKKNPKAEFVKAWLHAEDHVLLEAYRKEASREVGEMLRWMEHQIDFDPMDMLWSFSEDLFPMINRAKQYRWQLYDRKKKFNEIEFDGVKAEHATYATPEEKTAAFADLAERWNIVECEQMALIWRIKKIHIKVTKKVNTQLEKGEKSPFVDYEYDPEKS